MNPDLDIFISHSLLAILSRRAGQSALGAACVVLARQLHTQDRADDFVAWMESSPSERRAILDVPPPDRAWEELERYQHVCRVIETRIAAEDALHVVRRRLAG